jgi:hypothetical protein
MNIDNLHDALGQLDDELIEEVEALRSERKVQAHRRSKRGVLRYVSLAASVLLCVVSVYVVGGFLLNVLTGGTKSDSSAIVGEDEVIHGESVTIESDQDAVAPQDSSTENENASVATGEAKSEAHEIIVEVTKLINVGFIGVIKESGDTETYTVGTKLTVLMNEKDSTGENGTIDVQHLTDELGDVAFPVGSVVIVRFMNQDVVDTGNEEIMLYTEEVTLEENE